MRARCSETRGVDQRMSMRSLGLEFLRFHRSNKYKRQEVCMGVSMKNKTMRVRDNEVSEDRECWDSWNRCSITFSKCRDIFMNNVSRCLLLALGSIASSTRDLSRLPLAVWDKNWHCTHSRVTQAVAQTVVDADSQTDIDTQTVPHTQSQVHR